MIHCLARVLAEVCSLLDRASLVWALGREREAYLAFRRRVESQEDEVRALRAEVERLRGGGRS